MKKRTWDLSNYKVKKLFDIEQMAWRAWIFRKEGEDGITEEEYRLYEDDFIKVAEWK